MKKSIVFCIIFVIFLASCYNNSVDTSYYKTYNTGILQIIRYEPCKYISTNPDKDAAVLTLVGVGGYSEKGLVFAPGTIIVKVNERQYYYSDGEYTALDRSITSRIKALDGLTVTIFTNGFGNNVIIFSGKEIAVY